ncbi:hypothetical protein ACHAXH_009517 [Discostella pseudostelligera]
MPKASKVGKFRAASRASSRDVKGAPLSSDSAAAKLEVDTHSPSEKDDVVLSRGQKKRLAKREQYLNREKMVLSSLRLQRLEEQKGKIDGLDAIRDALSDAVSKLPANITKHDDKKSNSLSHNTNKAKKALAAAEITHMGLVLQHPSFVANPFAAIQQHLRNSLATDAEKLQEKSLVRKEEDDRILAKKKEEKKERIKEANYNKTRKKRFKSNRR